MEVAEMTLKINGRQIKPGEECEPGCFKHPTAPCPTCGRTAGLFPVDYQCRSTSSGGYLADVPKPHVRMFPNNAGVVQQISADVNSWMGLSEGAKHFYLRLRAEENPLWDPYYGLWRTCWDDASEFRDWSEQFEYLSLGRLIVSLRARVEEYEDRGYKMSYGYSAMTLEEYIAQLRDDWGPGERFIQREGD
jgi:hypothetical protein